MKQWIRAVLWAGTVPVIGLMLWLFMAFMSIFPKLFRGDLREFEYQMALMLMTPTVVGGALAWVGAAIARHYRKGVALTVLDEGRLMCIAVLCGLLAIVIHAKYPAWAYVPLGVVAGLWLFVADWRPVNPWRRVIRLVALIIITFMVIHHSIHY